MSSMSTFEWAEFGEFNPGTHDQEVVYFHRNIDAKDDIVLAGKITVDHVNMETTIEYSPRYVELENAWPICSEHYPLRNEPFVNKFTAGAEYEGIPSQFCTNNIDGYRGQLGRNSFVDEPEKAPKTPAQLLMFYITASGSWYFTPTRKLVRAIRYHTECDSLDDLESGENNRRVERRL